MKGRQLAEQRDAKAAREYIHLIADMGGAVHGAEMESPRALERTTEEPKAQAVNFLHLLDPDPEHPAHHRTHLNLAAENPLSLGEDLDPQAGRPPLGIGRDIGEHGPHVFTREGNREFLAGPYSGDDTHATISPGSVRISRWGPRSIGGVGATFRPRE